MNSTFRASAADHCIVHDVPEFPRLCRYLSERSPQATLAVEGLTHIVRYVNPAFCAMVGKPADGLVGRPFAEAVPEGWENGCLALLDRVFRTGTAEELAEQRHGTTNHVYWSYFVWAILGPDDLPAGVMIQVTDATEVATFRERVVQMNQELLLSSVRQHELTETAERLGVNLQAANDAKDRFLAVLSHELRTPLGPVPAALAVLERDKQLTDDHRETLRMIGRNIALEARLIDDLLDMTKIIRGKLELERAPVDLHSVIDSAAEVCRPGVEAGGLTLEIVCDGGPYVVDGDAVRLQQAFWNLLRNAVKFSPRGARIRVSVRRDGDSGVAVEVEDAGIGIEAGLLPRIFDAFQQGGREQTRKFGGLGLGLAITKAVIDMHGGAVGVRSAGKGRGATFSVTLPTLPGVWPGHVDAQRSAPAAAPAPRALRILLVEDHADTARFMSRLLSVDGHAVEWAADVAGGLKLAAEGRFDLLLCDLGLPDGSGLDLMRALRAQGSTLPGIVLSGYGQEHDLADSREAGFTAHLTKPVEPQKLWDAVAALGR